VAITAPSRFAIASDTCADTLTVDHMAESHTVMSSTFETRFIDPRHFVGFHFSSRLIEALYRSRNVSCR
jgi:hypothetical protein